MPPSDDDSDASLRSLLTGWMKRRLQPGEPQTWIEGGGNTNTPDHLRTRERDTERLEEYETAYTNGGPVAQLIDTRALMTFGPGSEFVTHETEKTIPHPETGEPETVADWLTRVLPNRDNLFVEIGRDAYIYGDSFQEIVETRGSDFSHIVTINPKTMQAAFDNNGEVREWIQSIKPDNREGMGGEKTQDFEPEEIGHIAIHQLGRHPLGVSLVGRNWDEIQRFSQNQHYIGKTVERHGMRKWGIRVGREGGPALDDNELRRSRQRFQRVKGNDAIIHGADTDIYSLDEGASVGDGISSIGENDLTMLAAGFGVPEEMAGLGRGSTEATAKVRLQAFERTARAEQRALADQLLAELIEPIIDEYSPFPSDIHVDLRFDDVVSDQAATAEWLRDFTGVYTADEMREKLGDGPVPDDVSDDDLGVPGGDGGETPSDVGGFFQSPGGRGRALSSGDWEAAFDRLYEEVLWSDDTGRQLFEFDSGEVPQFVVDRLRQAVLSGTLFEDFETLSASARLDIQSALLDSLEERHGWSINSIADNLMDAAPELSRVEAERIGRTETQALVADAREEGYSEQFDLEEERFYWVGPSDHRETEACEWLKAETNPQHGGTPVLLEELKELVGEANDRFVDHAGREWTPHISCRHSYVRNA